MRPKKETDADARLKALLPLIQGLPEEQRRNLADFLEALLNAHRFLEQGAARQPKPKKL
jgi:predicted trehalose synthase